MEPAGRPLGCWPFCCCSCSCSLCICCCCCRWSRLPVSSSATTKTTCYQLVTLHSVWVVVNSHFAMISASLFKKIYTLLWKMCSNFRFQKNWGYSVHIFHIVYNNVSRDTTNKGKEVPSFRWRERPRTSCWPQVTFPWPNLFLFFQWCGSVLWKLFQRRNVTFKNPLCLGTFHIVGTKVGPGRFSLLSYGVPRRYIGSHTVYRPILIPCVGISRKSDLQWMPFWFGSAAKLPLVINFHWLIW